MNKLEDLERVSLTQAELLYLHKVRLKDIEDSEVARGKAAGNAMSLGTACQICSAAGWIFWTVKSA